jgi:uncharacterized repeat protein (TIGR03803 family)
MSALVVGPDGGVYGAMPSGGAADYGTLFRVETNGAFTELSDFVSTDGYYPLAAMVAGPDGALYGSTQLGGSQGNYGTLFRVGTDATFTKLHDFDGTNDGSNPSVALTVGPDGALYGSTENGGTNGSGTLFRVETNGTFTKLRDFDYTEGYGSMSPALVVGPDGSLYGETVYGGSGGFGGNGTVFRVETNGTVTNVHVFNGIEGGNPSGGLTVGPDGALYGTTWYGGHYGAGTAFRLQTNGNLTRLHDFDGANGYVPSGPLVLGADGAFYGVTGGGGANGDGTLFRVEINGSFTKLRDLKFADDGVGLAVSLAVGQGGMVYGVTGGGGTNSAGTLFRIETDGTITRLHYFNGTDGVGPNAGMVVGPDGALYGSTSGGGGANYGGTLFRLETNGTVTTLHDFNGTDGNNPGSAAMALGPDGALYGTTPYGGPRQGGIIFKLVLNRPPMARCHDVTVSAGPNCDADASVDNGSFDPDTGDTIMLRQEPPGPYPLGVTPVTLTVTDNHGASNSCTATVTVMDTTPPTISDVAVTPNVLWPPNHKMVEVSVDYTATDNCGGVTNVLVVTSNEGPNSSGKGTVADWVIEDNHHVQLRAERSGSGSGRVYTVAVISIDNAGNASTKSTTVTVPKSRGK